MTREFINLGNGIIVNKSQLPTSVWEGEISCVAVLGDTALHTKNGDLIVRISIPPDEIDSALDLRRLCGMPIELTVKVWPRFKALVEGRDPDG